MRYFLVIALSFLCARIDCSSIADELANLNCTILLNKLNQTEVLAELETEENVTLLAPNNEAMEAATWPEDKVELEDLLKYHAVAQLVNSSDMTDEYVVNSTAGKIIRFNSYDGGSIKTAQGAPIDLQNVHVDVSVDNGLIHVLTDVMSPPSSTIYEWITNHGSFSKLKEAIDEAGLHEQFDNASAAYTLFAPNDEAFNKVYDPEGLLSNSSTTEAILLYHGIGSTHFSIDIKDDNRFESLSGDEIVIVEESSDIYINDTGYAEVIEVDKSVTNGVVHVINRVLKVDVQNGSTTLSIQTSVIITSLALLVATLQF